MLELEDSTISAQVNGLLEKKGSYTLDLVKENPKKPEDAPVNITNKEYTKKMNSVQNLYSNTIDLGYIKTDEKRHGFKRKDILKFEVEYKDILYDTTIRYGKYHQAFVPDMVPTSSYIKIKYFYGFPTDLPRLQPRDPNSYNNEIKYYQKKDFNLESEVEGTLSLGNTTKSDDESPDVDNDQEIKKVIENYCSRRKSFVNFNR